MQHHEDLPFDVLEEHLYVSLTASCSMCNDVFDTFDNDPPTDPMVSWVRRVASVARAKGWSIRNAACVCPTCAE